MADENAFEQFIRAQARKLRENDNPPKTREEWNQRRKTLPDQILAAIGPVPEKPCDLEPRLLGMLERDGFRIEKLIFQSRPDVWVTASAYVPALADGAKAPAVLVVHGHWSWARRDPVVLAPGILKVGDIPHLAALIAPRRLVIAGGVSPQERGGNQTPHFSLQGSRQKSP